MRTFKSSIYCLSLCLATSTFAQSDINAPLPIWRDVNREKAVPTYCSIPKKSTPPPTSFRVHAEYEPVKAVLIGNRGLINILDKIMEAAYEKGHAEIWTARIPNVNFPINPNSFYKTGCPINTSWIRDYGPIGMLDDGSLGVIDSIYGLADYRRDDDNFPTCLAEEMGIPSFNMNLVLDGGNYMVDSLGTLFMSKATYMWNDDKSEKEVDSLLKQFFNVKSIVALEYAGYPRHPIDGTGHIDMYLKLINDHTFILAESTDQPFKDTFTRVYQQLSKLKSPDGQSYKIYRVPGWYTRGTWYTYTNSLLVNGKVLMPSYWGHEQEKNIAIERYKEAGGDANLEVIPIDSDDSITMGGSIHCLTQTIPGQPSQPKFPSSVSSY